MRGVEHPRFLAEGARLLARAAGMLGHRRVRERDAPCRDCGVATAPERCFRPPPWEWYLVHDHVWRAAGMEANDGHLCIGCLESRLGRTLVAADFRSDMYMNSTDPWSVIHDDAHAGNLLRGTKGGVVICDLDSVAFGPPEWDLTPAAHGALRFGDDIQQNKAFADAYGLDVTTCPAWPTLRQIRELQLLSSVIGALPGRPDVASRLAHRLRTSLADDQATRWDRYQ